MLQHYSHIRVQVKREVLLALERSRPQILGQEAQNWAQTQAGKDKEIRK
jgi:hypothetical protein